MALDSKVHIDGTVIEAAVKHLRGICGSCMDSMEGDNYKVIFEDSSCLLYKY